MACFLSQPFLVVVSEEIAS